MSDNQHPLSSQPATTGQRPAKKSKSKPILLGVAAVVTMALIAGASFAFFSGFNPFADREPDYSQAPNQSNVMDFGGLSKDMRLSGAPLRGAAGTTESTADETPAILRFVGSETSILTRVSENVGDSWTASIPHKDIEAGDVEPIDEAPEAKKDAKDTDEESKLRGTPLACRISDTAVRCGDRSISLGDGSMEVSDKTAEADPDPASSAVPVKIDEDGKLLGPGGKAFDGLSFDSDAHVSKIGAPQAGESGPWVVSDGQTLAAVDDEAVLWTQKLDSTVAEVTGLTDDRVAPSWTAMGDVLIIGDSDGVKGLDLSTGDQLWSVAAKTEGFDVAGGRLRIHHEGKVSTFDFTDSSKDESVAADKNFKVGIPGLPTPKLPNTDDIRNATVDVPPACADLAVLNDSKQNFSDGKTSTGKFGESIAMSTITPSVASPTPLVAVEFVCYSGGNYVTDSVGVYDQNLKLVNAIEPWGEDSDVQPLADFSRSIFTSIDLTGRYMTAILNNIAVYGDEDYNAAERTAGAELRFDWSKGQYKSKDAVFTVNGKAVRIPKVDELQTFVDAAAKGNDKVASRMATKDVMDALDEVIGDGLADPPMTYREVALQKGTQVDTCELIGVVSEEFGDYTMRNGVDLMEGIGGYGGGSIRSGDVICGLKGPGETIDPDDEYSFYAAHLLLRGNETGAVKVYVVSSYTG